MNKNISLLVIDDDAVTRQLLEKVLSVNGFDVYIAEDGPSGLELAEEHDLDIILLDWMMPGMDGIEVLKRLKGNQKTEHVPIFMLTGKDSRQDIDHALSLGIEDYIAKPFNPSEIDDLIREKMTKIENVSTDKKKFSLKDLFSKSL
jgi:DNA-binding response OmpR family regulator